MDGEFDILLGGYPIGRAAVTRQGLYYHFDCRCDLSGEILYRLTVQCNGRTENLGIPAPEGGRFALRSRVAVKKLGVGVMEIRAEPKHMELAGQFIALSPQEPFTHLRRLQEAVFQIRQGQAGIFIPDV